MRFASRQNALFGNPEVGVGLVPGGGVMEWLPRLVGRSRALEIVLSADDFAADIAGRYGRVNRSIVNRWPRRRPRSIGSGRRQLRSFQCWPGPVRRRAVGTAKVQLEVAPNAVTDIPMAENACASVRPERSRRQRLGSDHWLCMRAGAVGRTNANCEGST